MSGPAGQGEPPPPLLCAHVQVPPAQVAPCLRKPTSPPQPLRCRCVPRHPLGGPAPPAHARRPGKGGPTSSALAVGRLHLDGAVHLQHTSGREVRAGPAPPPDPFRGEQGVPGATAGRPPAFLDCKGLQRRQQRPASPGPSSSTAITLRFSQFSPNFGLLPCVCTYRRETRVRQDTPGRC